MRVAVLGCGTVGAPVVRALCDQRRRDELERAAGATIELVGVAVARHDEARMGVPPELIVGDAVGLITTQAPDVVVELIGGDGVAAEAIDAAIAAGSSVVTANKALLSHRLGDLARRADERGVDLLFEAAVCGAIPVVGVLRTSLAGQRIRRVLGIVNGTTNFILTTMAREGIGYGASLEMAQRLGLAERDPRADVDGDDAAQKAAILASLAFGTDVPSASVAKEGISRITTGDIDAARRMGHVVRLLAVAERTADDELSVRVHPAMVPAAHPLAAIEGATNAVFVDVEGAGPMMLAGAGAGEATASAVLGDLVAAVRHRATSTHTRVRGLDGAARLAAPGDVESAFFLSVEVADRPGVLAAVATVFGAHDVSIRSMEQVGRRDDARLMFLTHTASTRDIEATVDALGCLDVVESTGAVLHVVDSEAT